MTIDYLELANKSNIVEKIAIAKAKYICEHYKNFKHKNILYLVLFCLEHVQAQGDVCIRYDKDVIANILEDMKQSALYFQGQAKIDAVNFIEQSYAYLQNSNFKHLITNNKEFFSLEEKRSVLVFSNDRIYMRRYFDYECNVAKILQDSKLAQSQIHPNANLKELIEFVFKLKEQLQDPKDLQKIDWQKVAVCHSLVNKISVISGGPGTGKTTTVLTLLYLSLCLDRSKHKIYLVAPTGKAAARMSESIIEGLERGKNILEALKAKYNFEQDELENLINVPTCTIHSLLGVVPNSTRTKYNANNKLDADIIILDEASMIDLSLFNKLLQALDTNTKLVLLGDKDQLCSVEAGSVLGDICKSLIIDNGKLGVSADPKLLTDIEYLSNYTQEQLQEGVISNYVCLLQQSRRFDENSAVGKLAGTINSNNSSEEKLENIENFAQEYKDKIILDFVNSDDQANQEIKINELVNKAIDPKFNDNYSQYFKALEQCNFTISSNEQAQDIFEKMNLYRILCSNHTGIASDVNINNLIERKIIERYNQKYSDFYPGKIILITQNNSTLNVQNGDVGFVAYTIEDNKKVLRAFFKTQNGIVRLSTVFLSNYESGFAMTIHKSQGSQYSHVHIALAFNYNKILTKELVYTAVTRSKEKVSLLCSEDILKKALGVMVVRESGLSLRIGK